MSSTPPLWRSRLAEAAVITLSILLAFGIDAWWEDVQQAEDDRSHLENVRRELQATDALLDDAIRLHGLSESLALEVLEMTSTGRATVSPDSLERMILVLYNSYVINAPTGALEAAVLSGAVARLPDEALKSQLLGWDSLLDDLLEEENNGFQGTRDFQYFLAERISLRGQLAQAGVAISGEIVGEGDRRIPPSRHKTGVVALLDDRDFENAILILLANAAASRDEATAFRQTLREALQRLDAVLS